ncbi:MAG: RrF2 family transcriptional regulator [Peptoniphilaceae bacterium]
MRITQELDYAFRICGYLAQNEGNVLGAPKIAKDRAIPERFTLRILRKLNLAGITQAKRGSQGGYTLKKPKENINLYDIVVAIDGPITINKCLAREDSFCSFNGDDPIKRQSCKFHCKFNEIQRNIINMFKNETLDKYI